ncbi:hypothetical protein PLESTB_001740100 [Pleodorina starrii]|uniref:Uncharacterized protein n=1 Tax=Pleodorina starrii TaxID=330485 RepID=A0A9W6FA11_9CHLO|nr:hypothetical protein PLESTM_000748200 [Pleodorina starrii]GLC61290.1 hypothetical protein PLESTB_001740100 [Pleodorina starrii]GLC74704.1 hypothetical protein PLESTF_001546500 [Pleodorina starrii]
MSIPAVIRSRRSAHLVAIRAWACAKGTSAPTAASLSASCSCGCNDAHLGSRWLSHLSCQRSTPPAGQAFAAGERLAGRFLGSLTSPFRSTALAMSTAAAAAATSAAASTSQAQHARLEPAADIPPERRAKLADELDAPGPSSGSATAGRRDRRPQRGASEGSSSPGPSAAGLGLPNDAEVQAVFDKIVGNLTKSGRKATARRIVLDAMRIMRGHLRKGDLDKIK